MIDVRGLRVVRPPATVALDGVDLTVEPGEFVVIIGRSGAGKTTFLRSINRLVEPTAGTVSVAGQPVTGADARALRDVRRHVVAVRPFTDGSRDFLTLILVEEAVVIEQLEPGGRAIRSLPGAFANCLGFGKADASRLYGPGDLCKLSLTG